MQADSEQRTTRRLNVCDQILKLHMRSFCEFTCPWVVHICKTFPTYEGGFWAKDYIKTQCMISNIDVRFRTFFKAHLDTHLTRAQMYLRCDVDFKGVQNCFGLCRYVLENFLPRALMKNRIQRDTMYSFSQHSPGHWFYTCSIRFEKSCTWSFVPRSTPLFVSHLFCIARFRYFGSSTIHRQTYICSKLELIFHRKKKFLVRTLYVITQRIQFFFQ